MTAGGSSTTVEQLGAIASARSAKSYLEIGVYEGDTFLNATRFDLRHGVDPHFRLDVAAHRSDSLVFFEATSDDFFTHHADPTQKYDVIFLDGLHTFEQTFRDFCASLAHSHDRTVWLIDDVYPSDVFSSHPDQTAAYRYRALHGGESVAWHGDVYKVVFAIHDLFPNLSYRTIEDDGNPRTVVIRRQRQNFAPAFESLEQISRMTYYDFIEHTELMNLAKGRDVYDWLRG